jgi:hypothetical protein
VSSLLISAGVAGLALALALSASGRGPGRNQPLLSAARGTIWISNSRNGQPVLNASNLAPGQSVSGSVSIANRGERTGALQLAPVNLSSVPGPHGGRLADVLQLRIQDQTGGGGSVFEGTLASMPVLRVGGIAGKERRTYLFTASLPAEVGNEYAGASAQVDLRWKAASVLFQRRCAAEFHGAGRGERLTGTVGGDSIRGRNGRDVIRGFAGPDCLYGGAGNDRLFGGHDDDRLTGGPGNDLLVGGGDVDRLSGGPGNDRILARGRRQDIVRCGPGFDVAHVDRFDQVTGCERVVHR